MLSEDFSSDLWKGPDTISIKTDDPQSDIVAQVMSLSISQHDVAMVAQQGMLQSSSGMNGAAVIPANKVIKPMAVIFFNILINLRYKQKKCQSIILLNQFG